MRSILFVSIAFPPKSDAEGLQVAKYFKYLHEAVKGRFEIDVLTTSIPTLNMHYDQTLEHYAKGYRQKIELPLLENRYTNFLLRHLWPNLAFSPDSKFSFHWQSRLVPMLLKKKPSLIYSRAFPPSSAVMGLKLKKHFQVPWVMHISDPWADDPFVQWRGQGKAINERLERECVEAADVISLTSLKTIKLFEKKYRHLGKRFEFFPNVYDPADVQPITLKRGPKLRIVHTGSLAGERSPETFLRAIGKLPENVQAQLDVVLAGEMDRRNLEILKSFRCDCLTYLGQVNFQRALELQRSADVLLAIDFPVKPPELRVYFLSKLLDYFLTGKPIMALSDPGSEVEDVINSGYGSCFAQGDCNGLSQHIEHLCHLKSEGSSQYFESRPLNPDYDAAQNSRRLKCLFEELLTKDSGG